MASSTACPTGPTARVACPRPPLGGPSGYEHTCGKTVFFFGFYSDLMGLYYTDSIGYEWDIPSGKLTVCY